MAYSTSKFSFFSNSDQASFQARRLHPSRRVVKNILAYSKALEVKKSANHAVAIVMN